MSKRITAADLEAMADHLNRIVGHKDIFYISYAYGGASLRTKDGRDVLNRGHVPKRELSELIHAFREGMFFTLQGIK